MRFESIPNGFRAWLAVVLAGLLGAAAAMAQTDPPAPTPPPPAPTLPAAPAAPAAVERPGTGDPTGAGESAAAPGERRIRLDQVVAVGNDARVRKDQEADEVVVVRGDALIDGDVRGDVVVILGKATVTGRIHGDLVVVLGEAEVSGRVDGDLSLVLTRSTFKSGSEIRGQITAVGVQPDIDSGAAVRQSPEVVSLGPLMTYFEWARDYLFQGVFLLRPFPPGLGWVWVAAGVFLALHLVIALLFAAPMRACMATLQEQPARSFLVGLLACILVGPVSILLSFTVVATPLVWLVFFAVCLFGRVAAYGATGAALGRAAGSPALLHPVPAVVAGSVLFYLAYMVPVLGFFAYFLVLPWGVGATLIRIFDAMRRERRPLAPPPGFGPGPGPGLGAAPYPATTTPGSLSAASALAAGVSGPATHAVVEEPPVAPDLATSLRPSVPPAGAFGPDARPGGAAPLPPPPPVAPLSPVEVAALPRVGFWPRFGASLIDMVGVAFLVAMTFGEPRAFWLLLGVYHFGMWGWKGTTLGGSILGLRVIRLDGRPVDWATAGVRVLGSVLSLIPLGIGFFWASWDDQCQSWHDRVAGTTVVKSDRRVSLV